MWQRNSNRWNYTREASSLSRLVHGFDSRTRCPLTREIPQVKIDVSALFYPTSAHSLPTTAIDGKKIFVCKGFFRPCAESRFLLSRAARLHETVYEMISPADVFGG